MHHRAEKAIMTKLLRLYSLENAIVWLTSKQPQIGTTPLDLIKEDKHGRVLELIDQLESRACNLPYFLPVTPYGRFGPASDDEVYRHSPCAICDELIVTGQVPSLVGPLRPVSEEDSKKADQGKAHTAEAQVAHQSCAYPDI